MEEIFIGFNSNAANPCYEVMTKKAQSSTLIYNKITTIASNFNISAVDNNVQINSATGDLYRYFDATQQAEFLYSCIQQAVDVIIPQQIDFLQKYDRMKRFLDDFVPMPNRMVSLLVSFLEQGNGTLSKRAKTSEFKHFTESEISEIETTYRDIFRTGPLSENVY